MATTEFEEPPVYGPTLLDRAKQVTGTDDRLSPRILVALVALGLVVATAPFPWALVGVAAIVLLVTDIARLAWKRNP